MTATQQAGAWLVHKARTQAAQLGTQQVSGT